MLSSHERLTENSSVFFCKPGWIGRGGMTDSLAAGRTECASETVTLTVCSCQFRQLVKRFPTFYETRRFVSLFETTRHFFLSITRKIQSTLQQAIYFSSILILSPHLNLGLPSGSSRLVSPPKFCVHFRSPQYMETSPPPHIS